MGLIFFIYSFFLASKGDRTFSACLGDNLALLKWTPMSEPVLVIKVLFLGSFNSSSSVSNEVLD